MEYILSHREPKNVLKYFEDISQIPRGSGNEKEIANFLVDFAKQRHLYVYTDAFYNVFIRKDATTGKEGIAPILLQGHTDMVCEKNMDVDHDFEKDPIQLALDGDFLKANKTTLGADDGIAVAYMLALLDSPDIPHPTLECLFTTQEETGLVGAKNFDASQISATRMLNLDSDNEHQILCGSAGGLRIGITKKGTFQPVEGALLSLKVFGLAGGHSGGDIHLEKGNANKLMGRILYAINQVAPLHICEITGGSKDNAIPRESLAIVSVPAEKEKDAIAIAEKMATDIAGELESSDRGFQLAISKEVSAQQMLDSKTSYDILSLLKLIPNGVRANSMALKGLVVTSSNTGVITQDGNSVEIHMSLRSSVESLILNLAEEIELLAMRFDASTERGSQYPGWKYETHSPMRDLCSGIYTKRNGKEAEVVAIHAGLECGLLKDKIPTLDVVSTGPYCYDIHTPMERLDLNSVERVWGFLLEVLDSLK